MQYLAGFLTVSLFALPVYGQTLPDFSRAVLAPLATKLTEEAAIQKRRTLARSCAEAYAGRPSDLLDWAAQIDPRAALLNSLRDNQPTLEQTQTICSFLLEIVNQQTTSRIAERVADMELNTTATDTDSGLVFAVCNEKTARTWKSLPGGSFKESGDISC
jgi:hypothetical protein